MKLVSPIKDAKPASRINLGASRNRLVLIVSLLTILPALAFISIARRTTLTKTTIPLQQVIAGPSEMNPKDSKPFMKPQASSAAPIVAIYDVAFSGSTKAWTQNHSGELLFTQDAGETWAPIGGDVTKEFSTFTITDGYQGWAVDYLGKIWKTNDGGYNWYLTVSLPRQELEDHHMSASQILFNGEQDGWVIDRSAIWRTSNAGLSWQEVDEFSYLRFRNQVRGMYFLDSRLGWAICRKGLVIHTNDGGDHWRSIVDGLSFDIATTINASRFLDENRGWISVSDAPYPFPENVVLFTEDGGKTWNRHIQIDSQVVIHDIFFLNDDIGWMAGGTKVGYSGFESGLLYLTQDGGDTWRRIKSAPISDGINFVRFTSPDKGWLTTDYSVYRTYDGGKTWASVLSYPEVKRRNQQIFGTE